MSNQEFEKALREALKETFIDILEKDLDYYRKKYREAIEKDDVITAFMYKVLEKYTERMLLNLKQL